MTVADAVSHGPIAEPAGAPDLDETVRQLRADGIALVAGTALDYSGVTRTKTVPLHRLRAFVETGVGASPSWVVFCADNGIAFTPDIGVTGDLRLHLDPSRLRQLGDGIVWGPTGYFDQTGAASPLCGRMRLLELEATVDAAGLVPLMGAELEFTLVTPSGEPLADASWSAYGARSMVARREFMVELARSFEVANVTVEQIHPEYGTDQFEVSLAPLPPLELADTVILARIVIVLAAARSGLGVSFSPQPFIGDAGNGMHMHLSLCHGLGRGCGSDTPGDSLFSGGTGPHGITAAGGCAIAGVLQALPELLGIYAGSVLSSQRLQPGTWSGAAACWGLENREAALRFIAATPGNPKGANIELKIIDPSANVYLAATALLGSALHGIEAELKLPAEVSANPADAPDFNSIRLSADVSVTLQSLAGSALATALFGELIVEGVVAVRRHELDAFASSDPDSIAAALRLAWS